MKTTKQGTKKFYSPYDDESSRKYYLREASCKNRMRKTNPEEFEDGKNPQPLFLIEPEVVPVEETARTRMQKERQRIQDIANKTHAEMNLPKTKHLGKIKRGLTYKDVLSLSMQPSQIINKKVKSLDEDQLRALSKKCRHVGKMSVVHEIRNELKNRGLEIWR